MEGEGRMGEDGSERVKRCGEKWKSGLRGVRE
jgi:hypothetical protein